MREILLQNIINTKKDSKWENQISSINGLFIIATPIGHMEDITIRALITLSSVDVILCEDTRVTRKLLSAYGIKNNLYSYHNYNEKIVTNRIINELKGGKKFALVSDSGTPLISDPGFQLVQACKNNYIPITVLPGPCSALTALVMSGFPCPFFFQGFLPRNKTEKKESLSTLKTLQSTLIIFEAPHRILYTLEALLEIFGDRNACLLRELTKKFEQTQHATLQELCEKYKTKKPIGEMILIIEGNKNHDTANIKLENMENILQKLIKEPISKKNMKNIAKNFNIPSNTLYKKILEIKKHNIQKNVKD
jgi:16S rRNA (cytidine1402-2'-O)-methyltransferase